MIYLLITFSICALCAMGPETPQLSKAEFHKKLKPTSLFDGESILIPLQTTRTTSIFFSADDAPEIILNRLVLFFKNLYKTENKSVEYAQRIYDYLRNNIFHAPGALIFATFYYDLHTQQAYLLVYSGLMFLFDPLIIICKESALECKSYKKQGAWQIVCDSLQLINKSSAIQICESFKKWNIDHTNNRCEVEHFPLKSQKFPLFKLNIIDRFHSFMFNPYNYNEIFYFKDHHDPLKKISYLAQGHNKISEQKILREDFSDLSSFYIKCYHKDGRHCWLHFGQNIAQVILSQ